MNTLIDQYLEDLSVELSNKLEYIFNYFNITQISNKINVFNQDACLLPLVSQYAKKNIDLYVKNFKCNVKEAISKDIKSIEGYQAEMLRQMEIMQDKTFYDYLQSLNIKDNPFLERYMQLLKEKMEEE